MAARPLFRLFLIAGRIVLAGILGGFIGKQLLASIDQSKQIIQKWKHIGKTLAATKMWKGIET